MRMSPHGDRSRVKGSEARLRLDVGSRTFRARPLWASNTRIAALLGMGGGCLMLVVAAIVALRGGDAEVRAGGLLFGLAVLTTMIAFVYGYGFARFPYEVTADDDGLRLLGAFVSVRVAWQDVRDIRPGAEGFVVRLRRRHRLLRQFVIGRLWGPDGEALVEVIAERLRPDGHR